MTLSEKKQELGKAFNDGKPVTLIDFQGHERTFTKFDVAKMFSVHPDSFSLVNVLKYGEYKIPGFTEVKPKFDLNKVLGSDDYEF